MGTYVMGAPVAPHAKPVNQTSATWIATDYLPSPPLVGETKLKGHPHSYTTQGNGGGGGSVVPYQPSSNPYVQMVPASSGKSSTSSISGDTVLKALGRYGKQLETSTKKAGGVAGSIWSHLKTGPNLTDAALSRLHQETKVIAEGGHEKVYQHTFPMLPGEKLRKCYACYLFTSNGPVIGTLYLSTARLAFCSDNLLYYSPSPGRQEWTHYKVSVLLSQLKAVNPSASKSNPAEKYIQVVTSDGHEFWFVGFVSYEKALKNLKEVVERHSSKVHQ